MIMSFGSPQDNNQNNIESLADENNLLQFAEGNHIKQTRLLLSGLNTWRSSNRHKFVEIFSSSDLTAAAITKSNQLLLGEDIDLSFPPLYQEIAELDIERESNGYLEPIDIMAERGSIVIPSVCLTCSQISTDCQCSTETANWITSSKLLEVTKKVTTSTRTALDSHSTSSNLSLGDIPIVKPSQSESLISSMTNQVGKSLLKKREEEQRGTSILQEGKSSTKSILDGKPLLPVPAKGKSIVPNLSKLTTVADIHQPSPPISSTIKPNLQFQSLDLITLEDQDLTTNVLSNVAGDTIQEVEPKKPILKGTVSHINEVDDNQVIRVAGDHFKETTDLLTVLVELGRKSDNTEIPLRERDIIFEDKVEYSPIQNGMVDSILMSQQTFMLSEMKKMMQIMINNQSALDSTVRSLKGEVLSLKNQLKQLSQKTLTTTEDPVPGRSRSRSRPRAAYMINRDEVPKEVKQGRVPSWKPKNLSRYQSREISPDTSVIRSVPTKSTNLSVTLAPYKKLFKEALEKYNRSKKAPLLMVHFKRILKEWQKANTKIGAIDIQEFENLAIIDAIATMEDCYSMLYDD